MHLTERASRYDVRISQDSAEFQNASENVARLYEEIAAEPDQTQHLIQHVDLRPGKLRITLDPKSLAEHLGIAADDLAQDLHEVRTDVTLRRRGVETKIIAGPMAPKPDRTLIAALARAHRWMGEIRAGTSIAALAETE